jgi:protein TonB
MLLHVRAQPEPAERLGSMLEQRTRTRRAPQLLASALAHAAALAALLLWALLAAPPPPEPPAPGWRAFFYDPPPAAAPPPVRGPGLQAGRAPARPREPPPRAEPSLVAPPEPAQDAPQEPGAGGGDPEGHPLGDPEGMPGGVVGGIVGGIPGGVVGGVIGGTGSGPAWPVPMLRPDTPPRLLRATKPLYPQDAFVKKVQGTVLLEILIDERGRVARARVLQSVAGLDQAALEAVAAWQFVPATHGGVPVATLAQAPIRFTIY